MTDKSNRKSRIVSFAIFVNYKSVWLFIIIVNTTVIKIARKKKIEQDKMIIIILTL